jgi:membrane protein DedA with SNARE-associated domain
MDDDKYQLIGLIGFIIAGFIFIAVGVKSGDWLTISGSVVWILSCLVWMVPILRSK